MITSGTQSVGTTRVALDGVAASPCNLYVQNNDETKELYIGGSDVTIANGMKILKGSTQDFYLPAGEQLFMVSTANGHTVSWLRIVQ